MWRIELGHDGALEEIGRQQALCQHQVMKPALLERRAGGELGLQPQLLHARIAVEIRNCLPRRTEAVTV
jgi:hypothetical protein